MSHSRPGGGVLGPSRELGPAYEALPGEDGWPIVGSVPRFTREPLEFLTELRREHGHVARFKMANLPYVLLSDPEGIRQVLVTEHDSFEKHDYLRFSLGDALGDGLLTAEGEDWKTQRMLAQPNFRPQRIRGYADAMVDQADRIVEAWRREPGRELHDDMTLLTLRIVTEALFDVSVDAKADEIGEVLDAVMTRFSAKNRLLALIPKSVPVPTNRRYHQGLERGHAIIEDLIDQRLADEDAVAEGEDLMSRMIRAWRDPEAGDRRAGGRRRGPARTRPTSDPSGRAWPNHEAGLDRDRLRDELMTFLVAGHETTALTLTWTLWLLGAHPERQAALAEELATELGDEPVTPDTVEDLELLDAVLEEAMRLLPAVWAFGRQATEDVEVAGEHLPEGTQVMMSQWVVHRDPELWDAPETFDPDRWLDGRGDDKPAFAHFPFGGGPRTCIGDSFATLEAKVCLAQLLRRFKVDSVQEERPELDPSITLRPAQPVRVRVEPRAR